MKATTIYSVRSNLASYMCMIHLDCVICVQVVGMRERFNPAIYPIPHLLEVANDLPYYEALEEGVGGSVSTPYTRILFSYSLPFYLCP